MKGKSNLLSFYRELSGVEDSRCCRWKPSL